MRFVKAAIIVSAIGFTVGVTSGAVARMDENSQAGQWCAKAEVGQIWQNGEGAWLKCVPEGNKGRWVATVEPVEIESTEPIETSVTEPDEPAEVTNPGLTG